LIKSLSCNDVVLTGIPFYFRVFRYSEFISLLWKEPYYDKFQCHKLQKRQFQSSRKILRSFQLSKSLIPYSRPDGIVKRPDALQCLEDFVSSALHPFGLQGSTSVCSLVFEKNLVFLCRQGSRKTSCNHPDSRATPSGRGLNMETCEARYGKAVA